MAHMVSGRQRNIGTDTVTGTVVLSSRQWTEAWQMPPTIMVVGSTSSRADLSLRCMSLLHTKLFLLQVTHDMPKGLCPSTCHSRVCPSNAWPPPVEPPHSLLKQLVVPLHTVAGLTLRDQLQASLHETKSQATNNIKELPSPLSGQHVSVMAGCLQRCSWPVVLFTISYNQIFVQHLPYI
jgi:hypothetical protein